MSRLEVVLRNNDISYQDLAEQLMVYPRELERRAYELFGGEGNAPILNRTRADILVEEHGAVIRDMRPARLQEEIEQLQHELTRVREDIRDAWRAARQRRKGME